MIPRPISTGCVLWAYPGEAHILPNLRVLTGGADYGAPERCSIVGTDRAPDNGYFRAKVAQEGVIKRSGVPYTVVRSTLFMEFLGAIADAGQKDTAIHIATGSFQPIAADDVARIVAEVAQFAPRNGTLVPTGDARLGEVRLAEWVQRKLTT